MPQAARLGDAEKCPNGSGPVVTGAATVFIEGRQAAVKGSKIDCSCGDTVIETGSPTVLIEKHLAARRTDTTCHKGAVDIGAATVFIGNGGGSGTGGGTGTMDRAHRSGAPFVRV
jgi:uncharacterized Zn-binding protein involved in type VI secretion